MFIFLSLSLALSLSLSLFLSPVPSMQRCAKPQILRSVLRFGPLVGHAQALLQGAVHRRRVCKSVVVYDAQE